MQDDLLHSHITAWEAMYFAVNLKIGNQLKRSEKKLRVSERLFAAAIQPWMLAHFSKLIDSLIGAF